MLRFKDGSGEPDRSALTPFRSPFKCRRPVRSTGWLRRVGDDMTRLSPAFGRLEGGGDVFGLSDSECGDVEAERAAVA
jgi:hypothetical protein